jgi:hypothetical protein
LGTFKKGFVILADQDGLSSVETFLGFTPRHHEIANFDKPMQEANLVLQRTVKPLASSGEITAVIVDTGTSLARMELNALKPKAGDVRQAYDRVSMKFQRLIRDIMALGVMAVFLFQEEGPRTVEGGELILGGPRLPGKDLRREIPTMFSLVLWAKAVPGAGGMKRVFACDQLAQEWIMKDRYGVTESLQTMDLQPLMERYFKKLQAVGRNA